MTTVARMLLDEEIKKEAMLFKVDRILFIVIVPLLYGMLALWGCIKLVRFLMFSDEEVRPTTTCTADVSLSRDAEDCVICVGQFSDGELTRVLPQCGHLFHAFCIDKWLESQLSYPLCRHLVTAASSLSAAQMV